jgi:tripartite-type tricarboxylate transporter receptor subunit TctC
MSAHCDRRAFVALTLAASATSPARAQTTPLQIVVGFAPGGASDAVARALAQSLQPRLARPVIVQNRPGGDGVVAAQSVASAAADAATLLLGSSTALVAVPVFRTPPPYDPFTAFTPVVGLGQFSMSLLVGASLRVRSVDELLRLLERRPGQIAAASSNSTAELALAQLVGWRRVLHVPYKGDAPALLDLIAGRVHFMFATGPASDPYVADGRLRRLGSTAAGGGLRLDVIPWLGLFGPAGLTRASCRVVAQGVQSSMQDPSLRQRLAAQAFEPQVRAPEDLEDYFRVQYARFVAAARRSGMRLER